MAALSSLISSTLQMAPDALVMKGHITHFVYCCASRADFAALQSVVVADIRVPGPQPHFPILRCGSTGCIGPDQRAGHRFRTRHQAG